MALRWMQPRSPRLLPHDLAVMGRIGAEKLVWWCGVAAAVTTPSTTSSTRTLTPAGRCPGATPASISLLPLPRLQPLEVDAPLLWCSLCRCRCGVDATALTPMLAEWCFSATPTSTLVWFLSPTGRR